VTARRWPGALAPPVLYAALIYMLSAQSRFGVELPDVALADKWIHLIEYGAFGFLIARAVDRLGTRGPRFAAAMAIAIGACYGATDELHQWFVPGRNSDGWDLLADTVGSALGGLVYLRLARARERRRRANLAGESP
jgi:VanZ family protein